MRAIYSILFSICFIPVVLLSCEDDCDFSTKVKERPQSSVTEGTIEEVTGDGDTYYDEQSDDGDWYYGAK
jgi:hypothetical protein